MFLESIKRYLGNLPGWSTRRKIIVFESDDWGSIRMASKVAYNNLLIKGIGVDKSHFNRYDTLESNADLESLFETLSAFRDKYGKPPVFTSICLVANPDFARIQESDFTEYFYEPYTETLKRYPAHDHVYELWKEGASKRLFSPQFHGREHLNVQRWLRDLQAGNPNTLLAFNNRVLGVSNRKNHDGYQAAFDIEFPEDLPYLKEVLKEGIDLFKTLMGYTPEVFVPTNGPFNLSLLKTLYDEGIRYLLLDKLQKEPLGNGKYKTHIRWLGKKNAYGQITLSRNAGFEPSASGRDWVDSCLKSIECLFKMGKPVTISSHRVNYVGSLDPANRSHGLKLLKALLFRIQKKWPDVEYMTSLELGELIKGKE